MQLQKWAETNVDELPEQLRSDPKTQRHQTLLRESKRLCAIMLEIIHRDLTSASRKLPPLPKGSSKSTLGMILNGCDVENVLIGGPAMMGGIERGDVVVQIDGKDVKGENVLERLNMDDTPGNLVPLSIRKRGAGQLHEFSIERIPVASVLDRVQLFKLFTEQKNAIQRLLGPGAKPGGEQASHELRELESVTQQVITTWSKMVVPSRRVLPAAGRTVRACGVRARVVSVLLCALCGRVIIHSIHRLWTRNLRRSYCRRRF